MCMKREKYRDELEFWCEDCEAAFYVAGYIEPLEFPEFEIVPADGRYVRCPNDDGFLRKYMDGTYRVPTHDVYYTGGEP